MAVLFTSDTHFGDPRVLRIDKRPFRTVAEHDEALIARWNETVSAEDVVWHLGDFARVADVGVAEKTLAALNGRKHLITGNNDGPATLGADGWASIAPYAEIEVEGIAVVLCHYPFRTWKDMGRGSIDLHGHSHGRLKPQTRQYDVGVDVWDYRPATLETILRRRRAGAKSGL
jgi:calcineurin-like phosphoesterase family protein